MATHEPRRAMWMRKAIGTALALSAISLTAPTAIAMADPISEPVGPGVVDYPALDSAINTYISRMRDPAQQFNVGAQSAQSSQQQLGEQLKAATTQLQEAIAAIAGR